MTGLRTSTWIWASAGTIALAGAMVACSLNPQPLPPDTYDGGASGAAGRDGSTSLALDSGALSRPDAGTTMPATGEDASSGASLDASAADGASTFEGGSGEAAGDAAIDAEDAGVAADATTDAAADGSTDATIDAEDAPGEAEAD